MPDTPDFGTLDIANFTVGEMLRAGLAIRQTVKEAPSIEDAAGLVVGYFYDNCVDPESKERSCALVRFYKTHAFGTLEPRLKHFAEGQLGDLPHDDAMRCLVLLGTAGDEPEWNSRHSSQSHQAIPLPSAEVVREAPMIARLIDDLGIDVDALVAGESSRESEGRNYDVFHVEEALGSPHIPAQRDFVQRHGIRSVIGFGGLLRSGELYAVILFSRVTVPATSARRFKAIALDIRSSLYALDEDRTWSVEAT